MLTEYVRQALSRTIVKPYLDENGVLNVLTIHPDTEELLSQNIQKSTNGSIPILQPQVITNIFDSLQEQRQILLAQGIPHVILTSPKIRPAVNNLLNFNFPDVAVLSLNEVPNEIGLETRGLVSASK